VAELARVPPGAVRHCNAQIGAAKLLKFEARPGKPTRVTRTHPDPDPRHHDATPASPQRGGASSQRTRERKRERQRENSSVSPSTELTGAGRLTDGPNPWTLIKQNRGN